jgi:3-oxoacyl-[acyl-carrier-protein] synthase III
VLFTSKSVRVVGTGSYAPGRIITNADLARTLPTSDEWIYRNLGIRERHVAEEGEFTSDLATEAARSAIAAAGIAPNDIELLIVATSTPDRQAPSTACLIQNKLGITNNCPAFDVAAVCTGFLYALTIGTQMLAGGTHRYALIIGADTFSHITDWSRRDAVFFGDGAGAAVITMTNNPSAFYACSIYADGRGQDAFTVFPGESTYHMNGRAVFDTATTVLPNAIADILARHDMSVADVQHLIPHQPSIGILRKTADTLGLDFDRVHTNMERYANTSGATIPLLLDEVVRSGKIQTGHLVAFAAVGSGWTWGAALMRWL